MSGDFRPLHMRKLVQGWKSIRMSSGMLQSNCLQLQLVLQSWNSNSRTLATILQRLGDGCDVSFCLVVRVVRWLFQDVFFHCFPIIRSNQVHVVKVVRVCAQQIYLENSYTRIRAYAPDFAWCSVRQVEQLQLETDSWLQMAFCLADRVRMKLLYFVFINMLMIIQIQIYLICVSFARKCSKVWDAWIKMTKEWGKTVPMLLHHSALSRKKLEKGGKVFARNLRSRS